jgi:4,5-dihydroxyphthalate decarboxylase
MILKGELDGALLYLNEPNLVDRSTADISDVCRPLFADPVAESTRYFRKNGIYPINHAMVIKRELHEKHPWAGVNIYHAFMRAKEEVERSADKTLRDYVACGLVEPKAGKMFSADPKSYGLRATRNVIETIAQYVHEQGLTSRRVAVEELFAPATLDL